MPSENSLIATPFRLLENVGHTFWSHMLMLNRNPAMCHTIILSTIHHYIKKFNYPRDFLWPIRRDKGEILSYDKVFFLAHAGHIRAYLHEVQPGVLPAHRNWRILFTEYFRIYLSTHLLFKIDRGGYNKNVLVCGEVTPIFDKIRMGISHLITWKPRF